MNARLDHVAIAVRDLRRAVALYELLGLSVEEEERVDGEQVRVAFLGEGPGRIELMEPVEPQGSVGRFLARKGEGLHHVALLVPSLDAALARCREAGLEVAGGIRMGSGNRRVAFLHPKSMLGVLVEMIEESPE